MGRAFSTSIIFNDIIYMAVITQVGGLVSVYLPDERLHHLVPNGRFTYNPEQRIKIDAAGMSPLQNLQLAVMAAIEFTDQNTESGKLQES